MGTPFLIILIRVRNLLEKSKKRRIHMGSASNKNISPDDRTERGFP